MNSKPPARARDTLVIVTSDHGMPFPGAKASPFESGHLCPLLIALPDGSTGSGGGTKCQGLVNWQDLAPTILEWIGVPRERWPDLPGRSLLPIVKDSSPAGPAGWQQTFYSHCFHEVTNYYPYRVVHRGRYKLLHNLASHLPLPLATDLFDSATWQDVKGRKLECMGQRSTKKVIWHEPEELFDLQTDPAETRT